jgi:MYXO-CTERM domain-containing protein
VEVVVDLNQKARGPRQTAATGHRDRPFEPLSFMTSAHDLAFLFLCRSIMCASPRSYLVGLLTLALPSAISGCSERAIPEGSEVSTKIQSQLAEALESADEADVILSFRETKTLRQAADREDHRKAILETREAILAGCPNGLTPTRQYDHVPAIAARLRRSALEELARNPDVEFIQLDEIGHGALKISVPAISGDVAKSTYNVSGSGIAVAVLDTGANASHSDLKSSISSNQHCFTRGACPPNNSSESTSATDDNGHGSHVSGIITSDGIVAGVGFAQDARIVPVKINDANDSGYVSNWVAGLDWVYGNLSTLEVKIVNMSICTDQLYASASACDAGQPALAKSISNLTSAGVTIFASSGNAGSSTQMSAPACNTGVIAVGATYKSNQGRQPSNGTYSGQFGSSFGDCADTSTAFDQIACFTNSNSRLDIVAPGAVIVSDYLGSQTASYWGTSQASPSAAGVAALMLECNPSLTPTDVKDILKRTGVPVTDAKNGLSFPSIRAAAAVKEACSTNGGASSTGGNGGTAGTKAATAGTTNAGATGAAAGGALGTGGTKAATGGNLGTGGLTGSLGATGTATGGTLGMGGISTANGGTATAPNGTSGTPPASGGTSANAIGGKGGDTSAVGGTRATGANVGTGGLGPSTAEPIGTSANDPADAGCACRAAGRTDRTRAQALAGLAILLGLARRRRQFLPGILQD